MIMVSLHRCMLLLFIIGAKQVVSFQPETENERSSAGVTIQHAEDTAILVDAYGSFDTGDKSQDKLMRSESQSDVHSPEPRPAWHDSSKLIGLIQSPYKAYQKLMADLDKGKKQNNANTASEISPKPNASSELPSSSSVPMDDERRSFRQEIAEVVRQALHDVLNETLNGETNQSESSKQPNEQPNETSENCKFDDWRDWSSCSVSCGNGMRQRVRKDIAASNVSKACSSIGAVEQENCSVDCAACSFGPWNSWSMCTQSCGGGIRQRRRPAENILHSSGVLCNRDPGTEREPCHTEECDHDCIWSEWADWTACTATCGGGVKVRQRSIKEKASGKGKICPGAIKQEAHCGVWTCPQDCQMSDWGEWASCTGPCPSGNGTKMRLRNISAPAVGAGAACAGPFQQESSCRSCCPGACSNCQWGAWGDWTDCSKTCGTGTQFRLRNISIQATPGGADCEGNDWDQKNCSSERDCGSNN